MLKLLQGCFTSMCFLFSSILFTLLSEIEDSEYMSKDVWYYLTKKEDKQDDDDEEEEEEEEEEGGTLHAGNYR